MKFGYGYYLFIYVYMTIVSLNNESALSKMGASKKWFRALLGMKKTNKSLSPVKDDNHANENEVKFLILFTFVQLE